MPIPAPEARRGRRGALLLVTLAAGTLLADGVARAADGDYPVAKLEVRTAHGRQSFNVRIADTAQRQELGLMFQTRLAANEGMLFPQPEPRVMSMWMKNTYIPLDMLFIDARGRIACLLANTKPQSLEILRCNRPAKAVLEIGGGEAAEQGIRLGDRVVYQIAAH